MFEGKYTLGEVTLADNHLYNSVVSVPAESASTNEYAPTVNTTKNVSVIPPTQSASTTEYPTTQNTTWNVSISVPHKTVSTDIFTPSLRLDISLPVPTKTIETTDHVPITVTTKNVAIAVPLLEPNIDNYAPTINAYKNVSASIPLAEVDTVVYPTTQNTSEQVFLSAPHKLVETEEYPLNFSLGSLIDLPYKIISTDEYKPTVEAKRYLRQIFLEAAKSGPATLKASKPTPVTLEADINMTKVNQAFAVYKGDHAEVIFVREESNFPDVEELYWKGEKGNELITKTLSDGEIEITEEGDIKFEIEIDESNINSHIYQHELRMLDTDGEVHTMATGTMRIKDTIIELEEIGA